MRTRPRPCFAPVLTRRLRSAEQRGASSRARASLQPTPRWGLTSSSKRACCRLALFVVRCRPVVAKGCVSVQLVWSRRIICPVRREVVVYDGC